MAILLARRRENREQLGPLAGVGLAQKTNYRQRRLLLDQIGADRLAGGGLVAEDVEQIVGDLEGDPQILAEPGVGLAPIGVGAGVMGPQPAAAQRTGRSGLPRPVRR